MNGAKLSQPHATLLAAFLVLTGAALGHWLTFIAKERDRKGKSDAGK